VSGNASALQCTRVVVDTSKIALHELFELCLDKMRRYLVKGSENSHLNCQQKPHGFLAYWIELKIHASALWEPLFGTMQPKAGNSTPS
jgi:hypothetical protein